MKNNCNNFRTIVRTASMNWDNPEEINMQWFGQDRDTLENILRHLYPDCDTTKLAFLYQCYDFLENQIHMLLEQDGYAYDKSKWILKQYFKELVGSVPDFLDPAWENETYLERKWNLPEFGDTDDWFDYIEAVADVYKNGLTDKNLKTINYMKRLQTKYMNR